MQNGRADHTATVLRDGRVLVVGGLYSGDSPGSAELYDPVTRTWSLTGNRAQECTHHTATRLQDGRVLVAGGRCRAGADWRPSTRAELYDPATGTWGHTGDLRHAREGHAATLLRDGRVLVVGGAEGEAGAELYDPATGRWSPTVNRLLGRAHPTATLLADGRVLVAGGLERPDPDEETGSAPEPFGEELYDPVTGTWSLTGSMEMERSGHSATLLSDGRVLVVGGELQWTEYPLLAAELYDPATGTWSSTRQVPLRRVFHTALLLPDGKVLVMGGADDESEVDLYDPALDTWEAEGNLSSPRDGVTATLLPDGSVLVAGGSDGRGEGPYATTELYDSTSRTWSPAWSMYVVRMDPSATLLPDGRVLFVGGSGGLKPGSAELYDPVTERWHLTGSMAHPHQSHAAVLLPDGRVLVAGGYSYDYDRFQSTELADVELYEPATGTWSPTGSMLQARSELAATLLRDGKVLIVGGLNVEAQPTLDNPWLTNVELYDPTTGTWSLLAPTARPHVKPTATLLRDGRVLVVGEDKDSWPELYDPVTGTWSSVGHMLQRHSEHRATLLGNGRVLVTSDWNVELYDPETNGWSLTAAEGESGTGHTATLLPDGKVLVTGGGVMGSTRAEVYDPETGGWAPAEDRIFRRTGHTATLLKDGRVLVAGGAFRDSRGHGFGVARAELYDPAVRTWSLSGGRNEEGPERVEAPRTHQLHQPSSRPRIADFQLFLEFQRDAD